MLQGWLKCFGNIKYNLATLDCFIKVLKVTHHTWLKMSDSPDILWVLLTGFTVMAWYIALEYTVFGQPDHAWLSWFFQTEENFFNYLATVLWSSPLLPFAQQIFWVAYMLWPSSKL